MHPSPPARPVPQHGVDLTSVDSDIRVEAPSDVSASERSTTWQREIPRVFAGLRVVAGRDFAPAVLAVAGCGIGRLAELEGGAHRVERRVMSKDASSDVLNVILQLRGASTFRQSGRRGELGPGDLVLIDGAQNFDLELGAAYSQLVLQLPRELIARRHGGLLGRVAEHLAAESPVTKLVFDAARAMATPMPRLTLLQRAAAFDGMIGILGALRPERAGSPVDDRFARAIADIDACLSDPALDAVRLADLQGTSRRRLEIAFAARGLAVHRVIWDRRLERAAWALADPAQGRRRVLDLALEFGFSSDAHFSRSFRRKFGVSPSAYRRSPGPATL